MRVELRCAHKLHGILYSEQILSGSFEVRCRSRFCGYQLGVVVIHTIDLADRSVITRKFKDPSTGRNKNGASIQRSPLRAP